MSEEGKKAAWDVVRACFYLLASIIWAQIIMAYLIWGGCIYGILSKAYPVGTCKELVPNAMELMIGGLAVVMAFSGRSR